MTVFLTNQATLDQPIVVDDAELTIEGKRYRLPPKARELLVERKSVSDLMPFVLNSGGIYNRPLNAFLLSLPTDGCLSPRTWRSYAYDLKAFEDFLLRTTKCPSLEEATRDEFDAYYRFRAIGTGGKKAVSPATWSRQVAALSRFYEWLGQKTGSPSRFPSKSRCRKGWSITRSNENLPMFSGTLKCVSLEDFDRFRDLGLMGVAKDPAHNLNRSTMLRDVAFAELAVSTGVRLSENASLLLAELPDATDVDESIGGLPLVLAEKATKGFKKRRTFVPVRVLNQQVRIYIDEYRSNVTARAKAKGLYDTLPDAEFGRAFGISRCFKDNSNATITYDSLDATDRKRLFVREARDVGEPAMLWLREDGLPADSACFSAAFARANNWLAKEYGLNLGITPHTLRHTYAVVTLSNLIRATIGGAEELKKERSKVSANAYRTLVGDPLRRLQQWLGHSSIATTGVYLSYLDQEDEIVQAALQSWRSQHLPLFSENYSHV